MASLTLKNVPDDLFGALREAAEGERRSLNQEILHLLTLALRWRFEKGTPQTPEVEAQLRTWRKLAGKWKSDSGVADELKQLAAGRSRGRKVDL